MTGTATAVDIPALVERTAELGTKPRRGRRSAGEGEQSTGEVLFFLGEKSSDGGLILAEKFDTEGLAMVEALKRDVPFYRVEVWKSRAVVKDGSVEITKEPVPAERWSTGRTSSEQPIDKQRLRSVL